MLIASLAITGRELRVGAIPSDSLIYNMVWIKEFVAALHRGDWLPRWAVGAFWGLGAPSFYYYPPLPFYVTGLVDFVSRGRLDPAYLYAWATFLLSLVSGGAMYLWLRDRAGEGWALIGGVLYVIAPYHVIDQLLRGSFGELTAYPLLPLLMIALSKAADDWKAVPWLALAYAGLIHAHIAVALLTTIVALPVYAGVLIWTRPNRLAAAARCLVGGALGLAFAASYLGPALLMQNASDLHRMWGGHGADPYNWTLLRPDLWPARPFADAMAWLGWGAGVVALGGLVAGWRRPGTPASQAARLWAVVCLLGLAMYATPWIWRIPSLASVQFPWRLLVVMEFAAISTLCMAASLGRSAMLALFGLIGAGLLAQGVALPAAQHRFEVVGPWSPLEAAKIAAARAPDEHLPADFTIDAASRAGWSLMTGPAGQPLVRLEGGGQRVAAASGFADGSVAVRLEGAGATRVVLSRFYFPAWRAERLEGRAKQALVAEPFGPYRYLSFIAPRPGLYRVRIVETPLERRVNMISALALIAAFGPLLIGALRGVGRAWRKRASAG